MVLLWTVSFMESTTLIDAVALFCGIISAWLISVGFPAIFGGSRRCSPSNLSGNLVGSQSDVVIDSAVEDKEEFVEEDSALKPFYDVNFIVPLDMDIKLRPELENLLSIIREATFSVKIATFSFGGRQIVGELEKAIARKVKVFCILDKTSYRNRRAFQPDILRKQGFNIKVHGTEDAPEKQFLFHQKYVIVDGSKVALGSFNISDESFNQYEDFIITNDERLVKSFLMEFKTRWQALEY